MTYRGEGAVRFQLAALCASLALVACGDDGAPPRGVTSTGDASAERASSRCGLGISALSQPCPEASCIGIPTRCSNDSVWVTHECSTRSDCEDRGNGAPYCIATSPGTGCICVQRCFSDAQCDPGSHCVCEPGIYGVCIDDDEAP